MLRRLLVAAGAIVWLAVDTQFALAANPAAAGAAPAPAGIFPRGPGFYFSMWKLACIIAVVMLWIHSTDWVSRDCLVHKLNYGVWNSIVFFTFVVAFFIAWIVPFFVGFPLLLIASVAPFVVFVIKRNKQVESQDLVFNKVHLRRWTSEKLQTVGIKIEAEKKSAHQLGPDVNFKAQGGGSDRDDNVNLITARQSPGFVTAKELIFDALEHRADAILMDYGAQMVVVRYQIDGIWHNHTPQERINADPTLAVLKTLAGLKAAERRARQEGIIPTESGGKKMNLKITSQAVQSGERVVLQFMALKPPLRTLEDLGMRPKMQEQLLQILNTREGGFFVVSTVAGGGLTTTFEGLLHTMDRFVRNFAAVEDVKKPEREVENVPVTTYDSKAGETPATVLPKLIRTYPEVLVVRDMIDEETVRMLCEQAHEKRVTLTTMRAKEAVEALLRVLLLKIPPPEFAAVATGALNVRLVRKLCDTCKEAYKPPSDVLRQLGLPAGRVEAFYRPPAAPAEPDKICKDCKGIGYRGRTGIFELLVVEDQIREALANTPKLELLRAAARKAKQRSLQEEGVLLVARGITSLPELMRVLKQ